MAEKPKRAFFDKNVQIVDAPQPHYPTVEETGLKGQKNQNRWAEARSNFISNQEKKGWNARKNQGNASEDIWKKRCDAEVKANPGLKQQIIQKYVKKGGYGY